MRRIEVEIVGDDGAYRTARYGTVRPRRENEDMTNPLVRLAIRALLAGVLAFIGAISTAGIEGASGSDWLAAGITGLGVAVGLASAELTTALNPSVGLAKKGSK